jgi:DNA polymerase-1
VIVFDLETDGLLPEVSKVHTLTLFDTNTNQYTTYDKEHATTGVQLVMTADEICGHNIITYDLPVIKKLYGLTPNGKVRDTIVLARLAYPEIKEVDYALSREGKLPGNLIGRHSLEAWGYRLGESKGQKMTDWSQWSQEMSDYCKQDVKVTATLLARCLSKGLPEEAIELEHTDSCSIRKRLRNCTRLSSRSRKN